MSVAGILLAAGQSKRFGAAVKQLLDFAGEPLVRRVAGEACRSRLEEVVVVVGYRAEQVEAALAGLPVRCVASPHFAQGLSRSVAAGIGAIGENSEAALFLTADQPFLSGEVINRILDRYLETRAAIVAPSFRGRRGSPTLFRRSLFPRLEALQGDRGGREVIRACPELVELVELESDRPLLDMDTPAEYDRLLGYSMQGGSGEEESKCSI